MSKGTDAMKSEKYDHQNVNYYHLPKLDYYKPDAFNQSDNPLEAFHIQNNIEPEYRYCGSQFSSNNKLHKHLWESCKGCHITFIVSIDTGPVAILLNKKKENL